MTRKNTLFQHCLWGLNIVDVASSHFAGCGSDNSNRVQQALNTFERGCFGPIAAFTNRSLVLHASQGV